MFKRPGLVIASIIAASVVVYLIGNGSVSLWDRDEPRYAQTSRQMLQSGDWVVPRLLDEVRTAKPVLIYWCQASAMSIFGDTDFAARLPSVIGMGLTLVVLGIFLYRAVDPDRAVLTVPIMATAGLSIAAAKMCLTDAVLLFFVTIAQLCLSYLYCNKSISNKFTWLTAILMWTAIGFAGLTKGPVVLGVQAMTMLVLLILDWKTVRFRWWISTKPLLGIIIIAIICAPWLILVHQREPDFLATIIGHDVVTRMTTGLEGHKGPPGYYLLTIWGTYFPWSLFLPIAMIHAWRNRQDARVRFALAAVIGPWVMFEIVQTKLPHYLLPVFPALAFLTADLFVSKKTPAKLSIGIGLAMLIVVAITYGLVLPRISDLRISPRIAQVLIDHQAIHPGDAIMIDYKETSLAFYQGGTIRPQRENKFLETTSPDLWPAWIVLTGDIWSTTPAEIKDRLDVIATVHGLNYADSMRTIDVLVLHKR
ncbi:MAG TPA: glycosyltransferase family 39 protein [Tepidisphaeraceae bacterium]|nr:glycosyltransferase family 39 protein [Tepidisphaeraceae bacterium]